MSDRGPGAGAILLGMFMILAGLCVLLVGGGCTVMTFGFVGESGDPGSVVLLLLSLATAVAGVGAIVVGIRLFRPTPPPGD